MRAHWAARWIGAVTCATAAACAAAGCRDADVAPPLVRGMQAYEAHCAACHGDGGAGDGSVAAVLAAKGSAPPSLADAERLQALGASGISQVLESGSHASGPGRMPVWGAHLGPGIQGDVTRYVLTLPQQPPAAREAVAAYLASPRGATHEARRTYVHFCSGCHGPEGAGDGLVSRSMQERLASPDLRDSVRYASLSDRDLRDFIQPRGGHAAYAPAMPGWIHQLDAAGIDDLVGYVRVLSNTESR